MLYFFMVLFCIESFYSMTWLIAWKDVERCRYISIHNTYYMSQSGIWRDISRVRRPYFYDPQASENIA